MSEAPSVWRARAVTGTTVLLGVVLLLAGVVKVMGIQTEVDVFKHFEIPLYLMPVAGLAEVAAAILLVLPRTTALGGVVGAGVMIIAIAAHLHVGETPQALIPLIVLGLCVLVGWARRANLARMLLAGRD